jgi:hypothetical protein
MNGSLAVPLPTYFTVGNKPLPARIIGKIEKDEEICENLHYLGKRSVTKTSEGIRIVTLGGILDPKIIGGQSKEQHLPFHTTQDATSLRGAHAADILLTFMWPAMVWNGSKIELPVDRASIPTSDAISDLLTTLRPRYHFAAAPADVFYEREAFYHPPRDDGEPNIEVTRFLSLAPFGNSAKAKALYAFGLSKETVTSIPEGSTPTPFPQPTSRKRPALDANPYSRFSTENSDVHHRRKRGRRERSPPPGPDRCFFCLSNPNLADYMVCSIGDEAYLATAKGPLPTPVTFKEDGLDFPGHVIIVPLNHAPSISTAAMQESAVTTFSEMKRFREALQAMISTRTKRKLGSVTWEINRARNIHTHWQFLPVPSAMVRKGLVEAAFRVEAENLKLPKLELKDFGLADEVEGDFFRVWIWAEEEPGDDDADGGNPDQGGRIIGKSLLMRFDENVRFDLQYGRKVMAKLLGLDERMVWQNCVQEEEEEKKDVARIRKALEPWDFTT